jgi:hypothetical protein
MEHIPSCKANSHSIKKFPAFYGTRRFITVFTTARHWSLLRLLLFSPKSFVFPSHIKNLKIEIYKINFASSVWVRNMVSHLEGGIQTEGF